MSKWAEIRNDYHNDDEGYTSIDAWKTDIGNEEGEVIAKVFDDGKVEYLDNVAKKDEYAQEIILEAVREKKISYLKSCKEAYEQLVEKAVKEADKEMDRDGVSKEDRDYGPWIYEAEGDSNAKEVIGYYLVNRCGDQTPYENWHENTDYLFETGKATEQDKEVEEALLQMRDIPELMEM